MNEQQIDRDRLRELASGATPGPWMFDRDQRDGWMVVFGGNEYPHGYNIIGSNEYLEPADAEFIAASRQAVPTLLDMLGQAEQRIRDLTQEVRDERAACLDQMEQVQIRDTRAVIRGRAVAVYQQRAREAEAWARLWKETARRAIRGERVLFRVNRQAREQMGRERGHLFRVAAERSDATERAERAEARIQAVRDALATEVRAASEKVWDEAHEVGWNNADEYWRCDGLIPSYSKADTHPNPYRQEQ